MNECDYFSVLSDGSTDRTESEKEIVYVRIIKDFYPTVVFLKLVDVKNARADGILEAINDAFASFGFMQAEYRKKLVGFGADRAAVNLGNRRSVSVLLKDSSPWLLDIHCMAHRLELVSE